MTLFRRLYGAHPLHLLVTLASFSLAGYAALQLFKLRTITVVIWFGGAAVAHDLLMLPLYGIIDFGMMHFWHRKGADLPTAPWVNYVRVPALISGILFLVYLPGILRLSGSYVRASTLSSQHFMGDWLLVTGVVFLASAITFAVRLRVMSKRHA